jgi:hypothetical protein
MPRDNFQIIGSLEDVQIIAIKHSIRDLKFLARLGLRPKRQTMVQPFQPRCGCNLQPRVAASATLGSWMKMIIQPQGGCVIVHRVKRGATALRLDLKPFPTQDSRSGNPGLEGITALRFRTKRVDWSRRLTHRHQFLRRSNPERPRGFNEIYPLATASGSVPEGHSTHSLQLLGGDRAEKRSE